MGNVKAEFYVGGYVSVCRADFSIAHKLCGLRGALIPECLDVFGVLMRKMSWMTFRQIDSFVRTRGNISESLSC